MLSYQHIYHAGNFADVHKHTALICALECCTKNPELLSYFDTHSGRGFYDMRQEEAQKIKEYKTGLSRVKGLGSKNDILRKYLDHALYKKDIYPGSSILAAKILRAKDKGSCFELHPQEFPYLKNAVRPFNQLKAFHQDGYEGTLEKIDQNSFVFIDPSYEEKNEYQQVKDFCEKVISLQPETTVMIWYPILPAGHHDVLSIKGTLQYELFAAALSGDRGMAGSGIMVINPPEGLKEKLETLAPVLRTALAQDRSAKFEIKVI